MLMCHYWHKRVFANGPGEQCSIPDRVMPKTQKVVLDDPLLNTRHYTVLIKYEWSNPWKRVDPNSTLQCRNY